MLGSFLGLYILNGEQRSHRLKNRKICHHTSDEANRHFKYMKVVMEKDFKFYKGKKEWFFRRKGKFVRQPREEKKSFRQRDEKKGKIVRKCFKGGDPNHLIGDCPKPPRNKDQKDFIEGSWSNSENEAKDKTSDETYLMAQSSNEVTLDSSHYSDNASFLDDDILNKHTMKVKKSLNVTFDESPRPTKLSPLVDDDVGEEKALENNTKVVNNNNVDDESIEVDKVEPKNVNEALGDESWVIVMQEELNQFIANDVWDLVPLPKSHTVIGT
ncbi:retrovirus-related pol polyprotein from transposon TNT 1-94 [Tanacetum coccineum]